MARSLFAEKQKDHLSTKVAGEFVNHISQNDSVSLGEQKVSVVLKSADSIKQFILIFVADKIVFAVVNNCYIFWVGQAVI